MKRKIKGFFPEKFENEIDTPSYSKKCWKDFRFWIPNVYDFNYITILNITLLCFLKTFSCFINKG